MRALSSILMRAAYICEEASHRLASVGWKLDRSATRKRATR